MSDRPTQDPFKAHASLDTPLGQRSVWKLDALRGVGELSRLPYTIKVLLESVLRNLDGYVYTEDHVKALATYNAADPGQTEIPFMPGRVVLQDFTGVPAVVDLAAMRDGIVRMTGDEDAAKRVNPLVPCDLVIDHSVQVDAFASGMALTINAEKEFERNLERYKLLKWAQQSFDNFRVVPPATGIVHQVNLEYLAKVVWDEAPGTEASASVHPALYPDSLVGTDSHTTMINGLGVLGWGVGGIEAEAVMLGQPVYMLIPEVVGFKLTGKLPEGATATDLVLKVTQMLRKHGVVSKFVEFFGPGLDTMPLANRATIANMAPEYGATCGFFPVDQHTLDYLTLTNRDDQLIQTVEQYCKLQGLWRDDSYDIAYTSTLELDMGEVVPALAGPKRPQDRIDLSDMKSKWHEDLRDEFKVDTTTLVNNPAGGWTEEGGQPADQTGNHPLEADAERSEASGTGSGSPAHAPLTAGGTATIAHAAGDTPEADAERSEASGFKVTLDNQTFQLRHGAVVIAAITSCTNTSNPEVMIAAGLLARNANRRGLTRKPWVKTSLAPGSKVVTDYYEKAGLTDDLEALGFHTVGYGCTTCIGNSGPLPEAISSAIKKHDLVVSSVLSGNRNFEGRINPDTKANYLASPPLVVAYAIAGNVDIDLYNEPLGKDADGADVYLKDLWPSQEEVQEVIDRAVTREQFADKYGDVFTGPEQWQAISVDASPRYPWDADSTYVQEPPFFKALPAQAPDPTPIADARCLVKVGTSVTTDHISPAGSIATDTPAGAYLQYHGVPVSMFNSYGARRGNDRVMTRGTFANIRVKNQLAPDTEGGYTTFFGPAAPKADAERLPGGEASGHSDAPALTRPIQPGEVGFIFDAAVAYGSAQTSDPELAPPEADAEQREASGTTSGTPLIVLAGRDYGMGSSRDWAAKGTWALGVRAVIAESYERIHRSNLIGMGVLPLTYADGQTADSLGLTGREVFTLDLPDTLTPGAEVKVTAKPTTEQSEASDAPASPIQFTTTARLDTPVEIDYYHHGGILHTVLRRMAGEGG